MTRLLRSRTLPTNLSGELSNVPDPGDLSLIEQIEVQLQSCNFALQRLGMLLSTDGIDPGLLTMLVDSVNRVRVAAWAAQKSIADKKGVSFERLLAGELARNIAK